MLLQEALVMTQDMVEDRQNALAALGMLLPIPAVSYPLWTSVPGFLHVQYRHCIHHLADSHIISQDLQ